MNPMLLMKIKGQMEAFNQRHPKLQLFMGDAMQRMDAGDVMEISLTKPDGTRIRTNIRITPEDKELLEGLSSAIGGKM